MACGCPPYLGSEGIESRVVDSSSIEVNRRSQRAKIDRIDAYKQLGMLERYWGGEQNPWSVVRVPSAEEEDARRSNNRRQVAGLAGLTGTPYYGGERAFWR
jgi:transposase